MPKPITMTTPDGRHLRVGGETMRWRVREEV